MNLSRILNTLLTTLLAAGCVQAEEGGPKDGPSFSAEEITIDKASGAVHARGQVQIKLPQLGLEVTAEEIVVSGKEIVIPQTGVIHFKGGKIFVEKARFVSDSTEFSFDAK